MSVVNQIGKLFNRKPAKSDTGLDADVVEDSQNVLTLGSMETGALRDSHQNDGMTSIQGDLGGASSDALAPEADEDLIFLPLLGRSTAAAHQRRLLALLAVGVVVLALIAFWVLRQADRSAQQMAATVSR